MMFDASGRLLAEPTLATAQCLVLLELHEIAASHSWTKRYRYFGTYLPRRSRPGMTSPSDLRVPY